MLNDFADWLSPMLVKELRQGVRARAFVFTLLILQVVLVFMAIVGLAAASNHEDTSELSSFFWAMTGGLLVLVLPMSGIGAIANERTGNTLDLIFLTQLSARRIIFGKWLSLVVQLGLLILTILPYIVLRYFMGGVDLWGELFSVALLLLVAAVVSAITVGLSPMPPALARGLIGVIVFLGIQGLMVSVFARFVAGRGSGGTSAEWEAIVIGAVIAFFLIIFMLECGAARIAPLAENHSTPIRLIGLAAMAVGYGIDAMVRKSFEGATFAAGLMVAFVVLGAICEEPSRVASVYLPFVRRGFLGRLAGRFLYPGWPSAVWYVALLFPLIIVLVALSGSHRSPEWDKLVAGAFLAAGAIIFPVALLRGFNWARRRPVVGYILVQVTILILYTLASILEGLHGPPLRTAMQVLPLPAIFRTSEVDWANPSDPTFYGPLLVTAACLIVLLWKASAEWKQIAALEKQALLMLQRSRAMAETVASS